VFWFGWGGGAARGPNPHGRFPQHPSSGGNGCVYTVYIYAVSWFGWGLQSSVGSDVRHRQGLFPATPAAASAAAVDVSFPCAYRTGRGFDSVFLVLNFSARVQLYCCGVCFGQLMRGCLCHYNWDGIPVCPVACAVVWAFACVVGGLCADRCIWCDHPRVGLVAGTCLLLARCD
jgi:hypothetical protein